MLTGCDPRLDAGSDVLWAALFEGDNFDEYNGPPSGYTSAFPAPSAVAASADRPHRGKFGARLTIDAGPDGVQENAGLVLDTGLPEDAYYSAWYYLPQSVTVGTFWVIFKFRMQTVADDPASDTELFDLNVDDLPSGALTLRFFDHRTGTDIPPDVPDPIVPVGQWVHIEAHYRNRPDASGRLTFWLDGRQVLDRAGAMAPTPWVGWDVVNVGQNLTPSLNVLYVDDCAVSLRRVGPDGFISR
jgi:hypothetical protein